MSRETDSPSSGPQGRGGAAYPSGTPAYGTPSGGPDAGFDADRMEPPQPPADEPETQTTLTTRIRINIPGSRPIPPVVMRKPMGEGGSSSTQDIPGVPKAEAAPEPAPEPEPPAADKSDEKASDWFAPRKPAPGAKGSGAGGPATTGGQSSGPAPRGDLPYRNGSVPETPQEAPRPKSGLSDLAGDTGRGAPPSSPSGPRPGAAGNPAAGGPPGAAGNRPAGGPPGAAGNRPAGGPPGSTLGGPNGQGPMVPGTPAAPSGPTTGPATGAGAPPTPFRKPAFPGTPAAEPPRMSDDTAVLTPQKPAPAPAPIPAPGQVSGSTLTSGIPVVPPGQGAPPSPFGAQSPPVAEPPAPAPAASSPRPAKKGRSKLVLAASGVIGLLGVAYGAGLLMNHSDVPKGTTVLGVDIGGGTRDDAVKKLDAALGKRTTQPLELTVAGKKAELEPEQAGLSLDTQATVRAAAGSDYNPVSVIGSLFGGEREIEPEMPVDEEKLTDALERISGSTSSGEGGITFSPGKATPVYGKEGKRINPQGSVAAIEAAYRQQVETGERAAVELPVSTAAPKVAKEEVDRMMKEFATPAMSGMITIRVDSGQFVQFSPEKSIYKFVKVVATPEGKLTEKYDETVLKGLYGSTFDGVMITRGTGQKTALNEKDVIVAVRQALRGKTEAERTVTIETNPS
ncbi:hypothetical protein H9Y04_00585 [Streptomyces sp. TRM66268-LWL]|uniref:Peptidoglycan binding domain-containing protein n=1 Tax=Streptomyces polyasparticus TaxID=2767826 RepID=A0ABR7S8G2_9ACTN|nr:hypothetical protein [Streptomyces polyasparticus]MBC9711070.1 hypothetical protein [Streptomyces polyasparticus]